MPKEWTLRQQELLISLGMAMGELVTQLKFDCEKASERTEVLEVLEAFYSGMYHGHLAIIEDDNSGTKDASKKL